MIRPALVSLLVATCVACGEDGALHASPHRAADGGEGATTAPSVEAIAASGGPRAPAAAAPYVPQAPRSAASARSPLEPANAEDAGASGTGDVGGDDADASVPPGAAPDAGTFPFPVFETSGAPLRAPARAWTYVEFADTRCRDGSRAGISLRLNPASKKVLLYLEGGVYCFDAFTCAVNPANVDELLFNSAHLEPTTGVFDTRNAQNPVRDWNVVYVPYCTGDAMGGTRATPVDVPGGPTRQYFGGHLNLQKFLQRIVPTFPDATDVLLVGMSAGGSSVLQNAVLVQRAFPRLKVRHVNDSSLPPVSKAVFAECLQDKLRTLWGLDQSSLAYCGGRCPKPREYWQDNAVFLAELFADRPSGFIDAIEDEMMRAVCGIGARNCTGNLIFDGVAAASFRRELLLYRERLAPYANYGTFLPEGTQHTFLKDPSFYTASAGGVKLVDWFAKIANGQPAGHAGP